MMTGTETIKQGQGHEPEKEKNLFIFVNRQKFDRTNGVKEVMTVDEIARLVGLTADTAVVRRIHGNSGNSSDVLSGEQTTKPGDQFSVTRKRVEGGCEERILKELSVLTEGFQEVEFVKTPRPHVIYKNLFVPCLQQKVDVIVAVPNGYPSAMIDRAGLIEGSATMSKVKGQPQEIIQIAGRSWRMFSYHPHTNGGGLPWNPSIHGFHTYLYEVLSWLEVTK